MKKTKMETAKQSIIIMCRVVLCICNVYTTSPQKTHFRVPIQLKNEMTLFMTLMQFANCINVMKIVIVIYLNMCTINISLPFPCNSKADGSEL